MSAPNLGKEWKGFDLAKAISEKTGLSVDALRNRKMRGSMPPPDVNVNDKSVLWYESTIDVWWQEIGDRNGRLDKG